MKKQKNAVRESDRFKRQRKIAEVFFFYLEWNESEWGLRLTCFSPSAETAERPYVYFHNDIINYYVWCGLCFFPHGNCDEALLCSCSVACWLLVEGFISRLGLIEEYLNDFMSPKCSSNDIIFSERKLIAKDMTFIVIQLRPNQTNHLIIFSIVSYYLALENPRPSIWVNKLNGVWPLKKKI